MATEIIWENTFWKHLRPKPLNALSLLLWWLDASSVERGKNLVLPMPAPAILSLHPQLNLSPFLGGVWDVPRWHSSAEGHSSLSAFCRDKCLRKEEVSPMHLSEMNGTWNRSGRDDRKLLRNHEKFCILWTWFVKLPPDFIFCSKMGSLLTRKLSI